MSEKKIKVVGLTGIMGAGKSSVIAILKELQVPVIDCDSINEQLQQINHEGYNQIVKMFKDDILQDDLSIDKQKLSQLIFHDKQKKQALEQIMHPLIKQEITSWLSTLSNGIAVVEVPLLFEIKWESNFDEIWVVSCNEEILLNRLSKFRNITKEEAKLRLSHQLSQKEKETKADYVLWNNTSKEDLKQQIILLLEKGRCCVKE